MAKFTVITTSGWQGDGWSLVGEFDSRKDAEEKRLSIASTDAKSNGYITAVIGETHYCQDHGAGCVIGDTSRVNVREPHLKSRKCHITDNTFYDNPSL